VIGGGTVGVATARELRRRDIKVTILEKDPALTTRLAGEADRVVTGDAANREILMDAGLGEAPSVVLSTNDDATNIFLAVYCRRLNPEVHIVSRVTQEWNVEAIHRAGADFVLSYNALAVKSVLSIVEDRELVVVGEGADLFVEAVPPTLAGKTLAESAIGAKTGLNVIALQQGAETTTNPQATAELPRDGELVMLGTAAQHQEFSRVFVS
jgi:voltage-gated potassium channel